MAGQWVKEISKDLPGEVRTQEKVEEAVGREPSDHSASRTSEESKKQKDSRMASGCSTCLAAPPPPPERILSVRDVLPSGLNTLVTLRTQLKRLKAM